MNPRKIRMRHQFESSGSGRAAPPKPRTTLVRRNGAYGIDAPYLIPFFGVLLIANVANGVISHSVWPFVGAATILACAGCGLYVSRRGKFVVWAELLDQLELRGDEKILDLGCGRAPYCCSPPSI